MMHIYNRFRISSDSASLFEKAFFRVFSKVLLVLLLVTGCGDTEGQLQYTVTLIADPPEGGLLVGEGVFDRGKNVTILAEANSGFSFSGWYDDDHVISLLDEYTFVLYRDLTITARFNYEGDCVHDCSGRECGPDPICGVDCGSCPEGGWACADGQCVEIAECDLPWGESIPNGTSVTAYENDNEPCGSFCTSEIRECNNGVLSGSYSYETCEIEPMICSSGALRCDDNLNVEKCDADGCAWSHYEECPEGLICSGGACTDPGNTEHCDEGLVFCNEECVDTQTSSSHCGACGNECPNGLECSNGVCVDSSNDVLPGLYEMEGALYLDGRPFKGEGVNAFDLFYRTLINNDDTSYIQSLYALGQAGIPFVRFNCGGYWPNDFALYFEDEEKYFELLDGVVEAAEEQGVGLIPSLFWAYFTAPDLNNEHMDQLGNPDSATSDYIREYTSKIVQRYRNSPAILAWEMGNEYNLKVDLPNPENHRPPVHPGGGTPNYRTEEDQLTSEHMLTAYQTFAETVRLYDGHRVIRTGNAAPRPSAWHNTHHGSWNYDNETQFQEILERDNPDPYDTVTVHTYSYSYSGNYTGDIYCGPSESLYEQFYKIQKYSLGMSKPVTVGEFGANSVDLGEPGAEERMKELLYAIEHNHVQLAAVWVYDFSVHGDPGWEITFENERSYMLDMIIDVNERIMNRNRLPEPSQMPRRLDIPNAYFQQGTSGWFTGPQGGASLFQSLSDDAVRGNEYGRMQMTAPGTYWAVSPQIPISDDAFALSLGGYVRFSGVNAHGVDVKFYDVDHGEVFTESLPLNDVATWEWHNIKEKGGGKVVQIPGNTDYMRIAIVVNAIAGTSDDNPAYVCMDNFSGFELVSFHPGTADADMSSVRAAPVEVIADGSDHSTITITVKDGEGYFRTAGGDDIFLVTNLGVLSSISDNLDSTYTATLSSVEEGDATVTAHLGTDGSGPEIGVVTVTFQ